MKLRYLVPLALICCFLLPACQQTDSKDARPALAVVDMGRVMRDSEPGREGVKFLEGIQAEMQQKLDEVQGKLEKDPKNKEAQQELQQLYMASQQRIQMEQQNVANKLYDMMQRVLNAYREQQGYTVILAADVAASYSASVDVTNAVIAEVNKQKMTFAPMPEAGTPAPADAPAEEQPAAEEKAPAKEEAKAK
ncbi:MAG: OmpH family outer membrane protein [Desulfovibrionaceae bacterium]|nr:OmpH family outer membrane protein [Desulfovibrionaceae bacterium]